MNHIKELNDEIKNMIAAGEVVEGPFSVVKELVENAIDASANHINIEAYESGLKKILVSDDGVGIRKLDLPLALKEHATSKISNINDITDILSYGFRGEALSSISSISKTTILSKHLDEEIGGKIVSEGNNFKIEDYAGATGTTVIVENLFYNTPARKKFLKSQSYETRLIRETCFKIAAAAYDISFKITLNNTKPLILKKRDSLDDRLIDLYGSEFINSMYCEKISDINVNAVAFLSKPDFVKSTSRYQQLFVNGRPIEYKSLSFHLKRAYEAIIPKGKYPAAFIYMEIKPELIDVNVHPAKKQIKFFDSKYIDSIIYGIAKKTLSNKEHEINLINSNSENQNNYDTNTITELKKENTSHDEFNYKEESQFDNLKNDNEIEEYQNRFSFKESVLNQNETLVDSGREIYEKSIEYDYTYIGIVFGVYIIIQKNDQLKIIDFHAAHERILFDDLIKRNISSDTQELIFPEEITLPLDEFHIINENIKHLKDRGFDMDVFSENSFIVRGIPSVLKEVNINSFLTDFTVSIEKEVDFFEDIDKLIVERIACHSAKRSNDNMTKSDIEHLLKNVFSGDYELRCPHGRPFVFTMTKSEFEKIFKR